MATPYDSVHLDSTPSTQEEARARFGDRPVLVTADRQTAGRGRTGNPWWSAARPLFASLALRPDWPAEALPRLSLVAGLAMREQLPEPVRLKWPNDLVLAEVKVGGLLAESSSGVVVVGAGVNLWWPDPPPGAGAVYAADPGPARAAELAAGWAQALLRRIGSGPDRWGREEYVAACATIGSAITWKPDGAGTAVGIAEDGALVVATGDGVRHLSSGHVHQVRPGYAVPPAQTEATE